MTVNGTEHTLDLEPDTPLLWVLREAPGLTGTKYGCGYCQSGVIMAVAGLLAQNPHPTDGEIDTELSNVCRCGTFVRMRAAIHDTAAAGGGFPRESEFAVLHDPLPSSAVTRAIVLENLLLDLAVVRGSVGRRR